VLIAAKATARTVLLTAVSTRKLKALNVPSSAVSVNDYRRPVGGRVAPGVEEISFPIAGCGPTELTTEVNCLLMIATPVSRVSATQHEITLAPGRRRPCFTKTIS
jgi:hypothetical protein